MTELVVHGHFYQPPRENPWTGVVEREDGAPPFHDWNERITAECYRPTPSGAFDDDGRIERSSTTTSTCRFNFGPTLLVVAGAATIAGGLRAHPRGRPPASRATRGHGNAIAQALQPRDPPPLQRARSLTQSALGSHRFPAPVRAQARGDVAPRDRVQRHRARHAHRRRAALRHLSPYQAGRVRELGSDEWTECRPATDRSGGCPTATFIATHRGARSPSSSTTVPSRARSPSKACSSRARRSSARMAQRARWAAVGWSTSPPTARATAITSAWVSSRSRTRSPSKRRPRGTPFTNYGAFLAAHPPHHGGRDRTRPRRRRDRVELLARRRALVPRLRLLHELARGVDASVAHAA